MEVLFPPIRDKMVSTASCTFTPGPMADDCSGEWLAVVERQQREIERLRRELRYDTNAVSPRRRGSDASLASSAALSVMSERDDAQPLDSERYAAMCLKMEKMRAELVKRHAKLRGARACCREAQATAQELRNAVQTLRTQVETQRAQLARERTTSQDKVDQAVDSAAQTLVKNDLLVAELGKLREKEAARREDVRVRSNALKKAEAARDEMQKQVVGAREEVLKLVSDVREAQKEKIVLQNALQNAQEEIALKRTCDSEWKELQMQNQLLMQRAYELGSVTQQQKAQLHQQVSVIEQQNQQIQQLNQELVSCKQNAAVECAENQRHAAHLLKHIIASEHELDAEQSRRRRLEQRVSEASETAHLLAEELLQTRIVATERDRVLQQRGEKYCELINAYRGLGRHAQALESSERELVSVLIPTKKRLALLQDTLTRFCFELEGVTKQMVASRNREISVGRALREYGKRNRELQATVLAARQQLHNVASAFRSSEKRKEQAVSANWNLKRDLVIERCQRTDLVQQCKELETCLDSCQISASESQIRAEGLEKDNGVLQQAVTQLVAYARELMNSQQSLQRELTKLEITGKRQPAVYG